MVVSVLLSDHLQTTLYCLLARYSQASRCGTSAPKEGDSLGGRTCTGQAYQFMQKELKPLNAKVEAGV